MRIDRVVGQRPADAAGIEQQRCCGERAVRGAPAHQRAPVEGQPQHRLWPVGDALHERIDGDDRQRGNTEHHGEAVELQQDHETGEAEQDQEGNGLGDAHLARRDGPEPRALHLAVKVPVGKVIQRAARAAHDDGTHEEQQRVPEIGQPAAEADLAQRQPPPAGQQQQPPADRALKPHQSRIGADKPGQNPVCPMPGQGIGHAVVRGWLAAGINHEGGVHRGSHENHPSTSP